MKLISDNPAPAVLVLATALSFLIAGCEERQVPRTATGEPLPFDHLRTTQPAVPAAGTASVTASTQTAHALKVTVRLSPSLSARAAATDTVFIFARAAQGPKMPLAIVRKQVRDLPVSVTLDDSMAMVAGMNMSSVAQLIIGARVSKSGEARPAPGDLEGYSRILPSGTSGPVDVMIDSVVGNAASGPAR